MAEIAPPRSSDLNKYSEKTMAPSVLRTATVLICANFMATALPGVGLAQEKEDPNKAAVDKAPAQHELEDMTQAARQMTGPAANYECVWHGMRVINLLHRDDLDTALRHLQIYDRFGCPKEHVQVAFRCFLNPSGPRDPKTGEALFDQKRAHDCWVNPNWVNAAPPATAATTTPPQRPGTTNR
jgi:hypothetical protein